MDERERAETYRTWAAAMPQAWTVDLWANDHISTAVIAAVEAGWSMEQLINDCLASHRRGAGLGLVVTRLRTLSSTPPPPVPSPVERSPVARTGIVERSDGTTWCYCPHQQPTPHQLVPGRLPFSSRAAALTLDPALWDVQE